MLKCMVCTESWGPARGGGVFINACRLLSALPSLLQFGRGRLSLVAISFYSLSLLFGSCRLPEFTLAGPQWYVHPYHRNSAGKTKWIDLSLVDTESKKWSVFFSMASKVNQSMESREQQGRGAWGGVLTFSKYFPSNSLLTGKSFQWNAQKFPHPGLRIVASDLSFTCSGF